MRSFIKNSNKLITQQKGVASNNISVISSMKNNLKIKKETTQKMKTNALLLSLQRPLSLLAAIAMLFGMASGVAEAAAGGGQVQYRSVKMSDNGVSGSTITTGVGSGTNVTYRVSFTAASSYTMHGVVVDFCSGTAGTPFIGDATCGAPSNFSVGASPVVDTTAYTDNSATPAVAYEALGATGDWTTGSLNSNQTFYMTDSTGVAIQSGHQYSFAISGITNPSDLGTFYARLITFVSAAGASGYTHTSPASSAYQDYGGFALSTANVVQVTAKVQETLTFCVSGVALTPSGAGTTPDCLTSTAPAIILGHGSNNTLDTSAVDTKSVYTLASTNALHGLTIRMHNSNACGGLSTDAGLTCAIPSTGGGSATPGAITAGTAAFGMHCNNSSGGTGSILCDPDYNDGTPTDYAMDSTTTGDNVSTTYGDQIAASTAPVNATPNQLDFAATASNTTPAGIYTANLAMIATGSF